MQPEQDAGKQASWAEQRKIATIASRAKHACNWCKKHELSARRRETCCQCRTWEKIKTMQDAEYLR